MSMRKIFNITFGLGLFCLPWLGEATTEQERKLTNDSPYTAQLNLGGVLQNPQPDVAAGELVIPVWQRSDKLLFTQFRYAGKNTPAQTSTAALAYRWLNAEHTQLWGLYGAYDWQQSSLNHNYRQLGFGAEMRTQHWHAYTNLYLPFQKQYDEVQYHVWELRQQTEQNGLHHVYQRSGYEQALAGGDINFGLRVLPKLNAWFYLGGYHFQASGSKSLTGPSARLQFDLFNVNQQGAWIPFLNRISFESRYRYDKVQHGQWSVGLNVVFDLGKQRQFDGLQQFMQYPLPRDYDIQIRHNDAESLTLYKNSDGSAFTVGQVSNRAEFADAITNKADLIAVQGEVTDLATQTLNDNQHLTGGDYQLSNGMTITPGNNGVLTAATGQDLLQVGKNNRIENITLQAESGQSVIVNNQQNSVGALAINNLTATAGINFKITDGSQDSHLTLTNSQFMMGDVSQQVALDVTLNYGEFAASITGNTIQFGDGDSNQGIQFNSNIISSGNSTYVIDGINNNSISFGAGDSNQAVRVNVVDDPDNLTSLTIKQFKSNNISFGAGDSNNALSGNVSSLSSNGSLVLNNIVDNNIQFAAGTSNIGFDISAGAFIGDGHVEISSFYNNSISLPTSATNKGILLATGDDASDSITVSVNAGSQGLSSANGGTSVKKDGSNITVSPSL